MASAISARRIGERPCPFPGCEGWNPAAARYCARCGRLIRDETAPTECRAEDELTRSVGWAYALWALWLVGFAGVHRFYTGRYVTGLLWLITWGLLGIGQVIDLFLISGMVEHKNRELARRGSWQAP